MASRRVSGKQRLELIQQALDGLHRQNNSETGVDLWAFVEQVEHALHAKLEPKAKEVENSE